jgi:hypothetical protein
MNQKHRILTNIGKDKTVTVNLEQKFDLLEILSLKFTQYDVYTSLCADYGVVCGRVSVNNGFGVPNARVSIFIPLKQEDEDDPVISALYPFKSTQDKNDSGYRYNLLPSRKQHGGHEPTGTFPDQKDILTREEYLEVYEKYYKYTVKTNSSGDFMIWGVPLGEQTIHVDVDLSDMGCFSLRPYDFIRNGFGVDSFKNTHSFKSSQDIDSLPQIVSFDKTIDVVPFWGNIDLCELGITRTDFDLSNQGVKVEPKAFLIGGTYTDTSKNSINKNCQPRRKMGRKCDLTTSTGTIEAIRFTTEKDVDSRPVLEEYDLNEDIPEDGGFVFSVPMNMDYVFTNEFGENEITNDSNKGIPTSACYRFRFNLGDEGKERTRKVASYIVPNIREYSTQIDQSYTFSTNWKEYPTLAVSSDSNRGILYNDFGQYYPRDYFYRLTYGKVYTVSSFQNSYFKGNTFSNDRYVGIKEIVPSEEEDCSDNVVTPPVNFGIRNFTFSLLIADVLLFFEHLINLVTLTLFNTLAIVFHDFADAVDFRPIRFLARSVRKFAYTLQSAGQRQLYLITYPECEECNGENDYGTSIAGSSSKDYCVVGQGQIQGSISGTERVDYNSASIYPGTSNYSWSGAVHNLGTMHPEVRVYIDNGLGGYTQLIDYNYTDPGTVPSNSFYKTGITTNSMDIVFTFVDPQVGYVEFSSDDSSNLLLNITNYTQQPCTGGTSTAIINNADFISRQNDYGLIVSGSTSAVIELDGTDNLISTDGTSLFLKDSTNSFSENTLYTVFIVDLNSVPPSIDTLLESGCQLYDTPYDEGIVRYYYIGSGRTVSYVYQPDITSTNISNRNEPLVKEYRGTNFTSITPSGESEFSNGVFYFIPATQDNIQLYEYLKEYRRRKRVSKLFCGGIVNYSFIDNWLSGSLYFFQFKGRKGKYCEDVIRYVGPQDKYYYRSAIYTNESSWGVSKGIYGRTLGRPTTLVDLGPRDEFIKEICVDSTLDPNCSVSRSIGPTSFQSFGELLGLAINYRMDVSNNTFDIKDFFDNTGFKFTNKVFDGDITQLISINNEAGIQEFDLQSPKYLGYSYQVLDPDIYPQVFKPNGYWGALPVTFEFDEDGERVRACLNEPTHLANDGVTYIQGRLTESSQKVPFFLWDKKGTGFGGTNEATSDNQSWDYTQVQVQPLQGMTYAYNLNNSSDDSSDRYLLLPMTYDFSGLTVNTGNATNDVEFDAVIDGNIFPVGYHDYDSEYPGFTVLAVTSGSTVSPITGTLYTRYSHAGTWNSQPWDYTDDFIIRKTQDYYSGTKQILSTPFMFYFGLKAGKTGLDKFVQMFGPKGAFPSAE